MNVPEANNRTTSKKEQTETDITMTTKTLFLV